MVPACARGHRRAIVMVVPTTLPGALLEMTTAAPAPTPNPADASLAGARAWFAEHGLSRPREGRMIAGVSAAFARRYAVNRLVAQVATLTVAIVFTPLAYVALWVLMPEDA
jgi:phage shock protein PspC (stress-responsive transcriptional regulator)